MENHCTGVSNRAGRVPVLIRRRRARAAGLEGGKRPTATEVPGSELGERPSGVEGVMSVEDKLAYAALAGDQTGEQGDAEYSAAQGMQLDPSTGLDKYGTSAVPEGKPVPVEPEDVEISDVEHTCSISIFCATILDNMGWLGPEKVELVPEDGWILKPIEVTFYEGERVFNVLLRTCKQQGIHMEFVNTPIYAEVLYLDAYAELAARVSDALTGEELALAVGAYHEGEVLLAGGKILLAIDRNARVDALAAEGGNLFLAGGNGNFSDCGVLGAGLADGFGDSFLNARVLNGLIRDGNFNVRAACLLGNLSEGIVRKLDGALVGLNDQRCVGALGNLADARLRQLDLKPYSQITLSAQPSARCIPSKSRWIASSMAWQQAQFGLKLSRHCGSSSMALASRTELMYSGVLFSIYGSFLAFGYMDGEIDEHFSFCLFRQRCKERFQLLAVRIVHRTDSIAAPVAEFFLSDGNAFSVAGVAYKVMRADAEPHSERIRESLSFYTPL